MDIVRMIQTAGVVGAGGAGFPTHIKLGQKAQYVLLNAAECEPLIRVDQELLSHFPVEVVTGLNYARECVSAEIAIIGIKAKHVKLIQKLIETIQNQGMESVLQVQAIKDAYPAGDEQVLVYELIGRIVPEGSIPLAVDCVVLNVETALNIYHSINKKPTTETFLTLAGDIEQPLTVKAPIGTPIQSILKLSNIEDYNQYAVIDGGPMMGNVLENLDGYISKKTKAFILLRKQSTLIRKKCMSIEQVNRINRSTCEQCRMCTDLCPRYLLGHNSTPHITMRAVNYNLDDLEAKKRSQLCCLCGLCELYSCPIGLFPKTANQVFRDTLLREGIRYQQTQESYAVRRGREYRLLPSKRLLYRLGLHKMDRAAPLMEETIKPKQVRIETSQHAGIPAVPIVSTGTQVLIGQLIAQIPDGSIGATIHASIDGIVTKVTKDYIEIKKDEV